MDDRKTDDSDFEYHRFCGYCNDECEFITSDSSYLLITNIWNEQENIAKAFNRLSRQTKKPKVWLWLDDGSTDKSSEYIESFSSDLPETEIWLEKLPPKKLGNLDTIGRVYNKIFPSLIERIDELDIDYAVIMDVDNDPCPNYCARIMWLLDNHPTIGAAAGIPVGEERKRKVGLPMGGGKIIRWSIMRQIKRYWDIAPDTLLNIKALANGFELKTWQVPMNLDRLTTGFTSKGVFRQGRLQYYVGRPFWPVFFRALRRLLLRQHGTQMLRGYLLERKRGTWRFDDRDVSTFFNKGRNPLSAFQDMIRFSGASE